MTFGWRVGTIGREAGGHSGSPITLTIPGTVVAGDFMILTYTTNSAPGDTGGQAIINDPAGWTAFAGGQQNTPTQAAKSWHRIAQVTDPSSTVLLGYNTATGNSPASGDKACATLDSYQGADNSAPIAAGSVTTSSTSSSAHVAPTVDTTGYGSPTLVVSWTADRENTEGSGFTPSAGYTVRNTNLDTPGSTGGRAGTCTFDSGSTVAAGSAIGGATVTSTQPAANSATWTVALKPLAAVQTARPTVDVTTTGWTPSVTLGGGVQECSLLADQLDTTFVTSNAGPSAQVWEAKLPAMSGPPDTVTNRIQFSGSAASGVVVTALIQGTTVIASRTDTYSSSPPTTPTDLVLTLTGGQQASISNLSDLRIRCTVTAA